MMDIIGKGVKYFLFFAQPSFGLAIRLRQGPPDAEIQGPEAAGVQAFQAHDAFRAGLV
jgi:hypothetical protein